MAEMKTPEDLQSIIDRITQDCLDLAKNAKGEVSDEQGRVLLTSGITFLAVTATALNNLSASTNRIADALNQIVGVDGEGLLRFPLTRIADTLERIEASGRLS